MGILEFRRTFSSSSSLPPQAQVWDCFNKAQALGAAFEVHEVALHSGFMPDEATTLSLTLAELAMNAVQVARGAVASVFFGPNGWRLEVSEAGPGASADLRAVPREALTSYRVVRKADGAHLVVAEYERPAGE